MGLSDLMARAVEQSYRERLPVIDFQYGDELNRHNIRLLKVVGQNVWGMEQGKKGWKCVRFNRSNMRHIWLGEFDSDLLLKVLTSIGKPVG